MTLWSGVSSLAVCSNCLWCAGVGRKWIPVSASAGWDDLFQNLPGDELMICAAEPTIFTPSGGMPVLRLGKKPCQRKPQPETRFRLPWQIVAISQPNWWMYFSARFVTLKGLLSWRYEIIGSFSRKFAQPFVPRVARAPKDRSLTNRNDNCLFVLASMRFCKLRRSRRQGEGT